MHDWCLTCWCLVISFLMLTMSGLTPFLFDSVEDGENWIFGTSGGAEAWHWGLPTPTNFGKTSGKVP